MSWVVLAVLVVPFVSALATLLLLPRLWHLLPRDRGRAHAINAADSVGKPVGVGVLMIGIFVATAALFAPVDPHIYFCIGAIILASVVDYIDDRTGGLNELTLGLTDLLVALFVCTVLLWGKDTTLWLPFTSVTFAIPFWLGILVYTPVVWLCINAVNCSDGVDGVSGSLSAVTATGAKRTVPVATSALTSRRRTRAPGSATRSATVTSTGGCWRSPQGSATSPTNRPS